MHSNYITAILLLTLSWACYGNQCNEQEWNKALVSQKILDESYNVLATKYNQWLPSFRQSVFLHVEFSQNELNYLWGKNTDNFQTKVQKQITAAVHSRQEIDSLLKMVSNIPAQVDNQTRQWQQLSQSCQLEGLTTNVITSGHYLDSNLKLKTQLYEFSKQLSIMKDYYDKEVVVLRNVSDSLIHH